jgi:hypothetical protein
MKLTIYVLAIAVAFGNVGNSAETRKAPEGVELRGDDGAVAKAGYEFYRVNDRKAASRRKAASPGSGKAITGEYTCTCTQGTGSCNLKLTSDSLTCTPAAECGKCQLKTGLPKTKVTQ